MSNMIISLLLTLFSPQAATCKDPSIPQLARDARVVVVAEIVEVKPALGVWSGLFMVVQRVHYEVRDVLKGEMRGQNIDVGYYIVANSSTADAKEARLSPKIFKKNAKAILFLTSDPGEGYISSSNQSDGQDLSNSYLALDSRCGLVPADAETVNYVKQNISSK
jgi:hypothetical protein